MVRTAHKRKPGFTLLELMVVMAIGMMLMTTIGGGILQLQSSMKLDNSLSEIKSEIQSTQSLARNSFFSNAAIAANLPLNDKAINIGWMISIKTNPATKTTTIIKQAILVSQPGSYDLSNLRKDIILFRQALAGKDFSCNSSNFISLRTNAGVAVRFSLSNSQATCSSNTVANEYISPPAQNNVNLTTTVPSGSTGNCMLNSANNEVNIFFTAGYGEVAISSGTNNCQIRITSSSIGTTNYRALLVNKDTGGVTTCGSYCP